MDRPLRIDKTSGIPVYIQLRERIRLLIHEGTLEAGQSMPTVRALAVELGVNANTVARVYRELSAEGVLELRRGVGTFVTDGDTQPIDRRAFRTLTRRLDELIGLARKAGMSARELSQYVQARWKELQDDEK